MVVIRRHRCNAQLLHQCSTQKFPVVGVSALLPVILKAAITTIVIPLILSTFINCVVIVPVQAIPMMIHIEPYDDECLFLKVPSSTKPTARILSGSYEMYDEVPGTNERISAVPLLAYILEVVRKGNNDNVNHSNNDKIIWRSVPNEARGTFRVPIASTKKGYWLCFQNSNHSPDDAEPEMVHPDYVQRTIGFDYTVDSIVPDAKPSPLLYTLDHTDEWRDKSSLVQSELRQLMTHRDYMHMREIDHRKLVEYTFDDIMSWTFLETLFVIIVAICQVLYFRRFIEKKQRF